MPFSQVTYTIINRRNYKPNRFRICFLAMCLTWALAFAIAGFVFLGEDVSQKKYLNSFTC